MNEEMISVGGVQTRVLTAGSTDAPPIVLLHDGGWGGSADMSWERMMPLLARNRRVLAPDMIGFGGTEKLHHFARSGVAVRTKHVLAVLDHFGIERAPFVGNSFGGTISLRALCEPAHRARLSAVVSITGTGGPWKTPKALRELVHFDGTREDMQRIVGLLGIDDDDVDYVDRRLAWSHVPGHYETMTAARTVAPEVMDRPGPPTDTFPSQLQGVETPLLLVTGLQDDLLEADWARHVARVMPHARLADMPSGHCPNITLPTDTVALIEDFLDDATPATPSSGREATATR